MILEYTGLSTKSFGNRTIVSIFDDGVGSNGQSGTIWQIYLWNGKGIWNDLTRSVFKVSFGNFHLGVDVFHSGFEVVSVQLDAINTEYKFTDWLGIHGTAGTASIYLGFDYKKGIGIEAKVVAVSGGVDLGFISVEEYVGVSIDVLGYLEWCYKPYIELYKWISKKIG